MNVKNAHEIWRQRSKEDRTEEIKWDVRLEPKAEIWQNAIDKIEGDLNTKCENATNDWLNWTWNLEKGDNMKELGW